jgi:23S rRNA pseudouridine2605 synthase
MSTDSLLVRLNAYIASNSQLSRRAVDDLIAAKKVWVNSKIALLGQKISEQDEVVFENEARVLVTIGEQAHITTLLLYKPIEYVSTRDDPQQRKTIYDLLPSELHHLKNAGRLDTMSEGLLVMSNDGNLIHALTHPKNDHKKVYLVRTNRELVGRDMHSMSQGVVLDDGYKTKPIEINVLDEITRKKFGFLRLPLDEYWYIFTLYEGRNRQIRALLRSVDKRVARLVRVQHGQYTLTEEVVKKGYATLPQSVA